MSQEYSPRKVSAALQDAARGNDPEEYAGIAHYG